MQFDLNEDQALLRTSTRELLENEAALADTRAVMEETSEGYAKAMHGQLGELGYTGLLLPEEAGGMGAIAFAIVMAEMGRVAFPGPFLDLALAIRTLADCTGEVAESWLQKAISGESLVVLARTEDLTNADPARAAIHFDRGRISGSKGFVPCQRIGFTRKIP